MDENPYRAPQEESGVQSHLRHRPQWLWPLVAVLTGGILTLFLVRLLPPLVQMIVHD